ncbi:MAG: DAK2 domain-containing protein [Clostridiales bacterium]|nr:DAK2 domain-containing protein [Clostridiales bacterium]
MADKLIGAKLMRDMANSAAAYLEQNKQILNDLNVFPVPDGDTGTNMLMTIVSSAREVNACKENATVGEIMKAMSNGALRGARGNSGVILSQLFRGFMQAIPAETVTIGSNEFASAMEAGVAAAYKAVMRPKEGTILTVAKAMAESGRKYADEGVSIELLLDRVIEDGMEMLNRTPEMLPVLKEAGVVDAGGAGLIAIYTGFKMAVSGIEIETTLDLKPKKVGEAPVKASAKNDISTAEIEYGYCSEFFIKNFHKGITEKDIDKLRDKLLAFGDSLVVVGDLGLLKVHVHSNMPGKVLQYALGLGELSDIKIENMREQHTELAWEEEEEVPEITKPMALVTVSAGEGLTAIFGEFEIDGVISGGQSMNPSADDIANAVKKAPSNDVIVLPNNKNIILAAQQAGELAGKTVHVIPSKSFPQGLAAVLAYNPEVSLEENIEVMTEAIGNVKSAEITDAVRDSHMNGETILKGEKLGILEGDIVTHKADLMESFMELLAKMVGEDDSMISIYTGEDASEDVSEALRAAAEEAYDCDVELYAGKQPVYSYIISVE